MSHALSHAMQRLSAHTSGRKCHCGAPSREVGLLCEACLATHPQMPKTLQIATLASAIRDGEKALEQFLNAASHQAAANAQMRGVLDALSVDDARK